MSKHLMVISVGPVQDFIGAARRTRDLWFGSELLSEISRAVAKAVKDAGGDLIFPNDSILEDKSLKVPNIILSELPDGVSPKVASRSAKTATLEEWKRQASDAKSIADKLVPALIEPNIWSQQIDDVIEFYSAWMVLPSNDKYAETRKEVMRLWAGRKVCREFIPAKGVPGRPKSSLDGARETIWNSEVLESKKMDEGLKLQLRLSDGEQLDVVGLTKRLGGGRKGYPSVSRIAVDPWLRGLAQNPEARTSFENLKKECEHLKKNGLGVTDVGWKRFESFPFEGIAVLRNRYNDLAKETGKDISLFNPLDKVVESLEKSFGIPEPYLAILMADGDRMGKTISGMTSTTDHRNFSGRLTDFARKVRYIVETENDHHGCLVYSGGDDVLAFVPVDRCLDCAKDLQEAFCLFMRNYPDENGVTPTLSVGIAIGHCMTPLEDLREYARDAESSAKKPDRNGFAVHLHPRSGAPIKIRGQWCSNFYDNQKRWSELHLKDQISDKTAFDLRKIAKDYNGWSDPDAMKVAVTEDIRRMLGKKIPGGADTVPTDLIKIVGQRLNATETLGDSPEKICEKYVMAVEQLANEWLIARRIAKSMKQATGKSAWEATKKEDQAV